MNPSGQGDLGGRACRHPHRSSLLWLFGLVGLVLGAAVGWAQAKVQASRGQLKLPTYPWAAVPHPYFRGTDNRNIYPYPMLDFLSRDRTERSYRTVVLENEHLRIIFLPELGGKIHEVIDKATGEPMFYVNHVVKPALIGQAGAWTSGGVEWNTGPQGHTVGCMQPIEVVILPRGSDGSQAVAIGETEGIYQTRWTVVVTLRPDRSFIEERIRIYNPTPTIRPYYFWNCTAVPNTPGFRFIYPMTLGTDHGAERFFHWPMHEGKDLTRGTNYQDASSIFAWHCDQDFFGSYNDDLDRGVVAYANHHQLPGKKAWTWGWGSYGTMHQMDLTDDDGPYNEVQTGPLLTQGEVGRLDPGETLEWQEWWYPIHRLGGFTYANRDVAVNAAIEGGAVRLRILGTADWGTVTVRALSSGRTVSQGVTTLNPRRPAQLELAFEPASGPANIEIQADRQMIAAFALPLALPERQPPAKPAPAQTATELAQAGWQDYLFAHFTAAAGRFQKALDQDSKCVSAHSGLAYLRLDADPAAAAQAAQAALAVDPNCGLARLALATAAERLEDDTLALTAAWQAALEPATAVAGRALAARLLIRQGRTAEAVSALSDAGPWQADPTCRNLLAFALLDRGDKAAALDEARQNLQVDPLDTFAHAVLWLARPGARGLQLGELIQTKAQAVLDLAATFVELGQDAIALRVLADFYCGAEPAQGAHPLPFYWAAHLAHRLGQSGAATRYLSAADAVPADLVFPHRFASLRVLEWACGHRAADGRARLYLGHLCFHLGRHARGRELWRQAAELGTQPVIAYRALGLASLTLDQDSKAAAGLLTQANTADPTDAIVARDLARVLFTLADQADAAEPKRQLWVRARDILAGAFAQGQGRSDFVALLARAHTLLGDYAETARLLDSVRITIWEGAREAHGLFEEAHLFLGDQHLEAGRATEALGEFDRALEYPANLATGRLEHAREAHIHYRRGNALAALGQHERARAAWQLAAEEAPSSDARKEASRAQAAEALRRTATTP